MEKNPSSAGMGDGRGRSSSAGSSSASVASSASAAPGGVPSTAPRPPRPLYPTDIPVLNELASLIGNLDLETPSKYRHPISSVGAAAATSASVDTSALMSSQAPSRTPAPTNRFSIAPDTVQQVRHTYKQK
jgi:hypothetical protein